MTKDNIIDFHYCNFCEKSFDEFDVDEINEQYCPNCHSTSSERLFYEEVLKNSKEDMKVLYLNSTGVLQEKINEKYPIETDINIQLYDDEYFDMIIDNHFLDIQDDEVMINQLNRILKKDAVVLIRENTDLELEKTIQEGYITENKGLRQKFYGSTDAHKCYGRDFIEILRKKGFTVSYHNPNSQDDNILLKTQLVKDPLFICKKVNHYDNIIMDKKDYDKLLNELKDLKEEKIKLLELKNKLFENNEVLKQKNEKLNKTIENIYSSNSWKITGILRKLRRNIDD